MPEVVFNSVHMDLLEYVEAEIAKLELPELPPEQVYLGWIVTDRDRTITSGAVMIAPYEQEGQPGGTNATDDIEYPIAVAILAPGNQKITDRDEMRKYLFWRQLIFRRFRVQQHKAVGRPLLCTIRPLPIVDGLAFRDQNLIVSGMTLVFTNREGRV